jgi:hypothetical protein
MEVKIYGLVDPRTNEIRYVGKTKQTLKKRLYKHIQDLRNNRVKKEWVLDLLGNKLKPLIIELETCDETIWIEREKHWIGIFNNLTNQTQGGEGGFFNDIIKEKISNGVKKAWDNPDYRKKIIEKRKEYWSNVDNRNRQSESLKNKPISDEHKLKIKLGRKDNKKVSVNGVEYHSIKEACRVLQMYKQTLKRRLSSKKYPEYYFINTQDINTNQ